MRSLFAVLLFAVALRGDFLDREPSSAASRPNPYEGQHDAALAGRKLFVLHCAACHGEQAQGHRKAPPLAQLKVHTAAPGTLFHAITNGSLRVGMPSFAAIPEPQRWQIVTYLKGL